MSGFQRPGGAAAHPDITGADGQRYTWDNSTGQYVVLPGAPARTAPATHLQLVRPTKANPYWHTYDPVTGQLTRLTAEEAAAAGAPTDPIRAAASPLAGLGFGGANYPDHPDPMQSLLVLSYGDGGAGGAMTAYQAAQLELDKQKFADQQQQDKLALSINILKQLAAQASDATQQAQYGKTNMLNAIPYMVGPNDPQFAPGTEPGGYAARMGLITPFAMPRAPFNPNLPPNPYTGQVDSGLAALQSLAR